MCICDVQISDGISRSQPATVSPLWNTTAMFLPRTSCKKGNFKIPSSQKAGKPIHFPWNDITVMLKLGDGMATSQIERIHGRREKTDNQISLRSSINLL